VFPCCRERGTNFDAADAFDHLDAPIARVTGADIPMPYALNLENAAAPTTADIVNTAKRTLGHKK